MPFMRHVSPEDINYDLSVVVPIVFLKSRVKSLNEKSFQYLFWIYQEATQRFLVQSFGLLFSRFPVGMQKFEQIVL